MNQKGREEIQEGKKWYGIRHVGRSTEGIKLILKEKNLTYTGKSRKMEEETKYKYHKKKEKMKKEEEGVLYKIECKECDP